MNWATPAIISLTQTSPSRSPTARASPNDATTLKTGIIIRRQSVTTRQTTNAIWTTPETGAQQTGTLVQQTTPDGTIYKEYSHASGWDAGLTLLSEVWAGGVRRKYTSVALTQDDTSLNYPQNPRVTESNIYDSEGNRRRTTVSYVTISGISLPNIVDEYGMVNGALVRLRRTITDHKWDTPYLNKRVIGLVWQRRVYEGDATTLVSKTNYHYDGDGWHMEDTPAPPTQHDSANYGTAYTTGRGNLTLVQRFDKNDPDNTRVEYKSRYNKTGSLVGTADPSWHQVGISYADSFSDNNNGRNTFAYPTKVTDADGNSSTTKYNYDPGGVTLTHSPASGTLTGTTYVDQVMQYDAYGRLERVTNTANGAYRRWVYESNSNYVHTYETIIDLNPANELHSWQIFDGAGRVRAQASDHPGSNGLYTGQYIVYDQMGRVSRQSNPTEINAGWTATGDDASWLYTEQAYDWKGRPTQTTNPDGSTRLLSFGGCGCAGGEVVTAEDEHGRKRRQTADSLGRPAKVEEMAWNGASVYSTTAYTYNALDQLTQINQQGQLRTLEYDGFGRLWKRTTPEQGTTEYAYNPDETINWVKDARGAKAVFGYNNRHMVNEINYDLTGVSAGQNVAATPRVTFSYDAAGHRTQMSDGMGASVYNFDALGRMTYEDRTLNGAGAYRLNYDYNLAGELKSVTNPWNAQVTYAYDRAGRVTSVGGANYAGVSSYAGALTYRAFGGIKGMSYGDNRSLSTAYDNRLRLTKWDVPGVLGYQYDYNYLNERTGRVSYAKNISSNTGAGGGADQTLDRSYEYDNVGRLVISHSGAEARAHAGVPGGAWGTTDGPFSHGYEYDQWGNMTHRYGWGGEVQGGSPLSSTDYTYGYTNNRRNGFSYDAAGNVTNDAGQTYTYDATGQQTYASAAAIQQAYDGDTLRVKKTENGQTTYYLRSSVLGGQVVAEINGGGTWTRGYVYLGGQLLGLQQSSAVSWVHEDPVTKSKRVTNSSGVVVSTIEPDSWGAATTRDSNPAFQPHRFTSYERDANGTDEAMMRRYNRAHSRFDQPDPSDASYDLADPQTFNRYAYTDNDPVNFVDPTGLAKKAGDSCTADGGYPGIVGNDGQCYRKCCENYIRAQKVTGDCFSGGDREERSDELRLTHRIASG